MIMTANRAQRRILPLLCGTLLCAALPAVASAGVTVKFSDVSGYGDRQAQEPSTLDEFSRLLQRLGQRLPAGQDLAIDVLDVRLAGMVDPFWPAGSEVRVLRATTPPRFVLRYVLSQKGRRLRADTVTLTDINYQMNPSARLASGRFPYEKALLSDWFKSQFSAPR